MIDQLPKPEPLPDDVRLRARKAIDDGLRPAPSRRTPALIAAGVGALVAGAVVAGQFLGGGATPVASPPSTPAYPNNGDFVITDLDKRLHLQKGVVDADTTSRCAAAAKVHPPVAQWTPVATTYKAGILLAAFRVPQGVFFCATTATTTSLSAPSQAKPAADQKVQVLFNGPNGSLAGLATPDVQTLQLFRSDEADYNSTIPVVSDGLFFAPRGYLRAEAGTVAKANAVDRLLRDVPGPATAVVDRPQPPADRQSSAGKRLGDCLRGQPYADPDLFQAGVDTRLSPTTTVLLGRHHSRLVFCRTATAPDTGSSYVYDPDELDEWRGSSLRGYLMSYDFVPQPEGGTSTDKSALIGLVTNTAAASITYMRPGEPDVTGVIANGTFVLPQVGIGPPEGAKIVVRDANGAVIEEIRHSPPR
jgi:hypothetical protein